jgi:hypothetical protein
MTGWARFRMLIHEDETHFLELTKHLFHQFFESELVARGGEARLTVVHILALLAVPPIFYTIYLVFTYDNIWWNAPWQYAAVSLIDHCRYIMLSMIVIGFVALLEWDALFLDRRDFAILMPLPVRAATIFAAKITALLLFLCLFILDVAGVPTFLYPLVETMGIRGPQVSFLRLCNMIAAHAVAVFSSSAFIFLFFVAVQGLLINFLPPRAFKVVSRCFQLSAIVTLLLALFLLMPITSNLLPAWVGGNGAGWFFWLPPLWFVGVYQTLLGSGGDVFHSLAWTAVEAFGLVALACGAGYLLNYRRQAQRALEAVETHPGNRFWMAGATQRMLTHTVLRKPLERATYFFVMNTLVRSTKHRLYVAAYVGVGFALAAFGIFQVVVYAEDRSISAIFYRPSEASLAIPLILSFFLLSGMRIVFTIPAELRANWVFQIAEDEKRLDCCAGVRKLMMVRATFLLVSLFPIYAALWGWVPALQQLIFSLMLSLILIELLLINFRKIPFTCSYQPGKANIALLGILYWLGFSTYAYSMATLERWLLKDDARWIGSLILMPVVLGALARWRRRTMFVDGAGIVYEDEPNPEVQTLGLGT